MALSAEQQNLVSKIITPGDYSDWLGAKVVTVNDGVAELTAVVRKDMLNAIGVCHGGVLFSLADTAVALAAHSRGRVSMSIEGAASFIEAVREGELLSVRAEETSLKNRLAFYRAMIRRADGTAVAEFKVVVYRTSTTLPS